MLKISSISEARSGKLDSVKRENLDFGAIFYS